MTSLDNSIISFFEFDEDLTDSFIDFLKSNGWLLLKSDGFPTIDSVHFTYEKEGSQIVVEMEHWCNTTVRGPKHVISKIESEFDSSI